MSTVPPDLPPTVAAVNPIPWEARETRGWLQAFFDTMGLFFSRPQEAWARTRETGDMASPLLFGTIICWFSFAVHSLISRLVPIPVLPGPWGRQLGSMNNYSRGGVGFVISLILAPVFIVIAIFIASAVLHVCCMIVGALAGSQSGFEGTLRVVSYSEVTSLASIVPVVGSIVSVGWWIVLAVMGIQRLHRTTQSKAVAAVLIPVVVCCGGVILIGILVAMAFVARRAH